MVIRECFTIFIDFSMLSSHNGGEMEYGFGRLILSPEPAVLSVRGHCGIAMQTVDAFRHGSSVERRIFIMSNHGLRRFFNLLLAVMMVCTLLPTAAFAEETVEQQPVVTGEQQNVLTAEGGSKEEATTEEKQEDAPKTVTSLLAAPQNGADVDLGGTGRHTMLFTIVYHTNYPNGNDTQVSVTYQYRVNNPGSNPCKMSSDRFKSYADLGFGLSGYTYLSSGSTWYTDATCNQVCGQITAKNGNEFHLYAGWKKTEPQSPDVPDDSDVESLLKGKVNVVCGRPSNPHQRFSYDLISGTYEKGKVDGDAKTGYTCTVTITDFEAYLTSYNSDTGKTHSLSPNPQTVAFTLKYENDKWAVQHTGNINVVCEDETTYTVTYTDGADGKVFADDVHSGLKADVATPAFKNGTPTREGYKFSGWTPAVTETVTGNATYTAVWEQLPPAETFTVTYTDGAGGKVFADDVHSGLEAGAASPAFKGGTPTRKNYIFAGWSPEPTRAVEGNATYTATWKPDFNNNGKDDDTEERYTVTYKDGVSGKVFKDEVHSDLLPGVDTPEFDGKLTRKGYTFVGWSPKVSKTVTKDVTYTATWKATSSTGKDNVPKTGDSGMVLILGSVMLFSFCGATAVYVFDRKRKQG